MFRQFSLDLVLLLMIVVIMIINHNVSNALEMRCSDGFVYDNCGTHCPPTCNNPNPICIDLCEEGCFCPKDRPILLVNGTCGTHNDCNGTELKPNPCEGNLVWSECPSPCPRTCENPNPVCNMMCINGGCTCPEDLPIRISPNLCVARETCQIQAKLCGIAKTKRGCKKNNGCSWNQQDKLCQAVNN
jgi:hypothetical protein